MTLDQLLGAVDFLLMAGKTAQDRRTKPHPNQVEQLVTDHPAQRHGGHHQRKT
ncbi:hypothetical protein D3C76_1462810 [compost metagenome]